MPIVSDDWKLNKYNQHVLEKGRFTAYVEREGDWWVHFNHSDGTPRLVYKGHCYLGVLDAKARAEREIGFVEEAIRKHGNKGKLNAGTDGQHAAGNGQV